MHLSPTAQPPQPSLSELLSEQTLRLRLSFRLQFL